MRLGELTQEQAREDGCSRGKEAGVKQAIAKEKSEGGRMFSNAMQDQGREDREGSNVKVISGGQDLGGW